MTARSGLPKPRGPLSQALVGALRHAQDMPPDALSRAASADPYGDDLQLALNILYELHYQGFDGVGDEHEWDPDLLRLRAALEATFLDALRGDVAQSFPASRVDEALSDLLVEPARDDGTSLSHHLAREGTLGQLREHAALRSIYHLKEADPHAWVIPRLRGRAKAGMVAVEYDEYGAGHADQLHQQLFADLMTDLGLDTSYNHYLDAASAEMLAVVNLMSLLGLHRALRGALVGQFATVEVTSSPGSRRLADAMRRTGAGPAAIRFHDEHVEADAVHEQLMRHEVVGGLLAEEPDLEKDVLFGIGATVLLEDRFSAALLAAWREGRSALREPL
ncbi:iron-containing redox enzyme family protein [Streptomyces montanisoli]|uniref:Iron-containing redox enzyme family protein n=1 Tax=Streptomyces montanisoli TaxID=2798581 RepID=A0A940MBG5_9ACTN|nr:iron-containing redox enzyme family protein [Streptomyces montanisoli]MBP0459870.1 iron-containing redox enzyme family protein [Streptomyces montanisoli]